MIIISYRLIVSFYNVVQNYIPFVKNNLSISLHGFIFNCERIVRKKKNLNYLEKADKVKRCFESKVFSELFLPRIQAVALYANEFLWNNK